MRRVIFILFLLISISATAKQADTIKLYFNIGVAELKASSKQSIDSLLYYDKFPVGKKIGIVGYADYLGSEETNATLSEKRAQNVQAYLISMGIKAEDIQVVTGKGEVSRDLTSAEGYATDRRVDIIPGGIKNIPQKKPVAATKKIDLTNVKENGTITLNKILFYPGSHKVKEESYPELKNLYEVMRDNPTVKIQIEGHICCLTPNRTDGYDYDSQDFTLSTNRAKAIYDFLVERKITADRLSYKGFGKSRPLVANEKTEEDENKNRRVEIRILQK